MSGIPANQTSLRQPMKELNDECKELPEFKFGDCASCHDSDVLLTLSDDEENPLSYVCKECFLRGY